MTTRPTMYELALLLVHIRDASPRRARTDLERLRRELTRVMGRDGHDVTRDELVALAERRRAELACVMKMRGRPRQTDPACHEVTRRTRCVENPPSACIKPGQWPRTLIWIKASSSISLFGSRALAPQSIPFVMT